MLSIFCRNPNASLVPILNLADAPNLFLSTLLQFTYFQLEVFIKIYFLKIK